MQGAMDAPAQNGGDDTVAKVTPTKGESLLIWRNRTATSQVAAAESYGVSVDRYRDWEADKREDQPKVYLGDLRQHEICLLLRRRSGKTQREVAAALGLTRLWMIKMEGGEVPIERLTEYWGV